MYITCYRDGARSLDDESTADRNSTGLYRDVGAGINDMSSRSTESQRWTSRLGWCQIREIIMRRAECTECEITKCWRISEGQLAPIGRQIARIAAAQPSARSSQFVKACRENSIIHPTAICLAVDTTGTGRDGTLYPQVTVEYMKFRLFGDGSTRQIGVAPVRTAGLPWTNFPWLHGKYETNL